MIISLLLVFQIASKTYTAEISSNENGYIKIPNEYNRADISIAAGQALMLVEWEDAFIEITIPGNKVNLTKASGLSFFTFKDEAEIHMEFISGVSFFHFPYKWLRSDWKFYVTNVKNDRFVPDTNENGYHLFHNKPYNLYIRAENDCNYALSYNSKTFYYYSDHSITGITGMSSISDFRCPSGLSVSFSNNEDFTPTVPTTFNSDISSFESLAYGGTGDNQKEETEDI